MPILTKPTTIAKGQTNEITLDKTELLSHPKVLLDDYYSDINTWKRVVVTYKSDVSNQRKVLYFNSTDQSQISNFNLTELAKDGNWEIQSIIIYDFDNGSYTLTRDDLTVAELDIILGNTDNPVYSAFDYISTLRPSELDAYDNFGYSVSISGNYIVVGANNDDGVDNSTLTSGAAYVFKINIDNTITLLDTLRPDGLDASDWFGGSVAMSGNYIVVGAHNEDGADNSNSNSGAAYVYKINGDDTITLLDTLRPDGLDDYDYFGWSVSISGNYIVIGVDGDDGVDNTKTDAGAAYVFKINIDDTITLLDTLRPDGLDARDWFGRHVSIDGNYIVVGAYRDDGADNTKTDSGAAYVYKVNGDDTITLLDTLRPDGLDAGDFFGGSVSISGNYIVVGAYLDDGTDNSNSNSGAAYVFNINGDDTITLLDTLRPNGLDSMDYFGASVSISGNCIVVGVNLDDGTDNSNYNSGAAYVFKINGDDTITLLGTLRPDGLDASDIFGKSVSISGDYIVVGAYNDDGVSNSKSESGAAYVFKYSE